MAKGRHEMPKPRRQDEEPDARKRGGKQKDVPELQDQLNLLGLKIVQVTPDGNCFFRALADQIEGDEDKHQKYRKKVVRFIKKNRDMFEPFVEDEVPFNEYCQSMGEDGTWAGHMELQAASLVTQCNICIHKNMSPRWYIQNFNIHEARMIHLSYHDGLHYNSVRSKDDSGCGPARPIVMEDDADLSVQPNQPEAAAVKPKEEGGRNIVHGESIKLVKSGSGFEDTTELEQQVGGDVDAAVDVLVAERGSLVQKVAEDELSTSVKNSYGLPDEHQDDNSDHHQGLKIEDDTCKLNTCINDAEITDDKNNQQPAEKKISRKKVCPCGSKKKYKSCCGSVAGKSSARFPVNQTVDYGKGRRDRKQGRKSASTAMSSIQSNGGGPPDMGGLCI